MTAQNVVIAVLVLEYSGYRGGAAAFVAGVAAGGWALMQDGVVSGEMLGRLMAGAGVLGVVSKVPQIWTVWREGGTGQLSAFAVGGFCAQLLVSIWHRGWGSWTDWLTL